MPSSRVVGSVSVSGSRDHREYSDCTALSGVTAWALRIRPGDASLIPA